MAEKCVDEGEDEAWGRRQWRGRRWNDGSEANASVIARARAKVGVNLSSAQWAVKSWGCIASK
jgi:hypothetical protein